VSNWSLIILLLAEGGKKKEDASQSIIVDHVSAGKSRIVFRYDGS
jgi:hypothetical protein